MPNSKITIDINAIWDDESGSPSPLSAADVDTRISMVNDELQGKREALERVNAELEAVIAQRAALIERMDVQWEQLQSEATRLSVNERETRRRARQLLKQANGMA